MAPKSPTSIFENYDGRFCLTVMDESPSTSNVFDQQGLQGGGYTWEGIVRALVDMRMPGTLPTLDIGAEADNMYVYCKSRQVLEDIAALVQLAIADQTLLLAAIDHAGSDLE